MIFKNIVGVIFLVIISIGVNGQNYDLPCEAFNDPVDGWPNMEFSQTLSGSFSGISPFLTENASGGIQDFGITGADSSLFYKLELDPGARHVALNFSSGTFSDLSLGLIGIEFPCPNPGDLNYGEELYSNSSGDPLLESAVNVSQTVLFSLCALDADDYENLYLWMAVPETGVGSFSVEVTQYFPPSNFECNSVQFLGRLNPNQEVCEEGDNSWSCPTHLASRSDCLNQMNESGYAVSWYSIATQEYTNKLTIDISHFSGQETVVAVISPDGDCDDDFVELLCGVIPNGQGSDLEVDVLPSSTYYILVATDISDARAFELCITGGFECRVAPDPHLSGCMCAVEPICSADDLHEFCFSMEDYNTIWPDFPECPNANFDNPVWFSFVGGDEITSLKLRTLNCEDLGGGIGIRVAVYSSEFPVLPPGCADCDPAGLLLIPLYFVCDCTTDPVDLSLFTTPGRTYYVVVDGCSGSTCDVAIEVLSGGDPAEVDVFDLDNFSSPEVEFFNDSDTVCTNAEDVFIEIDAPYGAAILEHTIIPGIPENTMVNFMSGVNTFFMPRSLFEQEGSIQFCVTAYNDCESSSDQICKEIFIKEVEPFIVEDSICRWDMYIWEDMFGELIDTIPPQGVAGDYFFTDSLFGTYNCKQDQYLHLHVRPDNEANPTTEVATICAGETYEYFGSTYTESGIYPRILEDQYGCDSFVNLVLVVLEGDIILDEISCFYNDFTICPSQELIIPELQGLGLGGSIQIEHEWYQLSTDFLLDSGTDADRCLTVNLAQLDGDIDSFSLHIYLQYEGEPVDPGCFFGPFDIELDTDDFYPGEPELNEPAPVCVGDTVVLTAQVNQTGVEVYYDWEFQGISLLDYEIISGFNQDELEVVFQAGGNFGVCVSSFNTCLFGDIDCSRIDVIDPEDVYAGPDTTICGLDYSLLSAGESGMWSVLSSPDESNVQFDDIEDPTTYVQVNMGGEYIFEWTEITAGLDHCSSSDTVSVTFTEGPVIAALSLECDSLELNYTVTFEVLGDFPPFEVLSENGSIEGGTFESQPVSSGEPLEVFISNHLGCTTDTLMFSLNCNCLPRLGAFNNSAVSFCESECFNALDYYDTNGQTHVPGLDTVTYILHTEPNFVNDVDRMVDLNSDGIFCFDDLMLETGRTYYLYIALGRADAEGLTDFEEECTLISQSKAVSWIEWPRANAGPDQQICGLNTTLAAEASVGDGMWTAISGPGNALFGDSGLPASPVSVENCGEYVFQWKESNSGCSDSSEVVVVFNCNPAVVTGSMELECTGDDFYSVSFELEGGSEPYSEAFDRGSFVNNLFEYPSVPAGTADTFYIVDANGCERVVSVYRNCDCGYFAGELSGEQIEICLSDSGSEVEVGAFEVAPILEPQNTDTYILHDVPGDEVGQIMASSTEGIFAFDPDVMECNVVYFISHVVADSLADGGVDWDDTCLSVSEGRPVSWLCNPEPNAGADDIQCGLVHTLSADPAGAEGFWNVFPSDGVDIQNPESSVSVAEVAEAGAYCFIWTQIEGECTGVDTVCITFVEYPELVPGSLEVECDSTGAFYRVSFLIQGGDSDSYDVDGDGELEGNRFISFPVASGDPYLFVVTDRYACEEVIVSGETECDCISQSGTLSGENLRLCINETVNAGELNYNSDEEELDGDDVRVFLLSTRSDPDPATIIAQSTDGVFAFDPQAGMEPEVTYWLVVAVGNESIDGGVDPEDPCISYSAAIEVIWYDFPELEFAEDLLEIDCENSEVHIEILPDESFLTYQWSTTDGQITAGTENQRIVEVQSAGQYTATVTDQRSGCEAVISIVVTASDDLPVIVIAAPDTINCYNPSVILEGSLSGSIFPFTLYWEGPGLSGSDSSLNIEVDLPGEYTLNVENEETGCFSSESVVVYENTEEPGAEAVASGELNCSNEFVIISAVGLGGEDGIEIEWMEGDSNAEIATGHMESEAVVTGEGLYILFVTNTINGCVSVDSIRVEKNPETITGIEVSTGGIVCAGDEDGFIHVDQVFGGTIPYRFSFDGGESFSDVPMQGSLGPGSYTVVVEDDLGCTYELEVNLVSPPPLVVDLGPDQVVEPGTHLRIEASVNVDPENIESWLWEPLLDPDCLNCPFQEFVPQESVLLQLEAIDSMGCRAYDEVYIRIFGQNKLYIPNAFSPNSDGINDFFGIYSEEGSVRLIEEFSIYNRWGERVFHRTDIEDIGILSSKNSWNGIFNGEEAPTDTYVYQIRILFEDGVEEFFRGEVQLIR